MRRGIRKISARCLPYDETTHSFDHQDHHYHHHGRQEVMKDLIHNIGELVKSILKLILLGETPGEPGNPDNEKASE